MTLLKVQPDKAWLITESRLRFEVDAMVEPKMVPLVVARDLQKSIEILERTRQWRVLERVPARKAFGGDACCPRMLQPAGTPLNITFEPSVFQGDTDDAHNFDEIADPESRVLVDGKVDWVAVVHFWSPALFVNPAQEKEESFDAFEGFAKWDSMPEHYWPALRKRYAKQ